jgi:hypothetical protein
VQGIKSFNLDDNSHEIFSLILFLSVINGTFIQDASARPDKKRGINFVITSQRISPKAFAKGYEAEKKEQAHMFEKERRRMAYKQNGWNFLRYLAENKIGNNPTRFR